MSTYSSFSIPSLALPIQCYIRFFEMFQVADLKPAEYGDKEAKVCPNLSQHEVRAYWFSLLVYVCALLN